MIKKFFSKNGIRWGIVIVCPVFFMLITFTPLNYVGHLFFSLGFPLYCIGSYFLCKRIFAPFLIYYGELAIWMFIQAIWQGRVPAFFNIANFLNSLFFVLNYLNVIFMLGIMIIIAMVYIFIRLHLKPNEKLEESLRRSLKEAKWALLLVMPIYLDILSYAFNIHSPGSVFWIFVLWVALVPFLYGILGYLLVRKWYMPVLIFAAMLILYPNDGVAIRMEIPEIPGFLLYHYRMLYGPLYEIIPQYMQRRLPVLPFVLLGTLLAMLFVHLYRTRKKRETPQAAEAK